MQNAVQGKDYAQVIWIGLWVKYNNTHVFTDASYHFAPV